MNRRALLQSLAPLGALFAAGPALRSLPGAAVAGRTVADTLIPVQAMAVGHLRSFGPLPRFRWDEEQGRTVRVKRLRAERRRD